MSFISVVIEEIFPQATQEAVPFQGATFTTKPGLFEDVLMGAFDQKFALIVGFTYSPETGRGSLKIMNSRMEIGDPHWRTGTMTLVYDDEWAEMVREELATWGELR